MYMLQVKLNSGLKFLTFVYSGFPLSPSPNYELGLGDKQIERQPRLKILGLNLILSRNIYMYM